MGRTRSTVLGAFFAVAVALGGALGLGPSALAADLAGTTWTVAGGRARVAFAEEDGGGLVGRIVWLAKEDETGQPALDDKNPDESLRGRPLNGVAMVWGFDPPEGHVWDHGQIYAADDGKTYNARMTLDGDTLVLTGCIRWPLCRDTEWTRWVE